MYGKGFYFMPKNRMLLLKELRDLVSDQMDDIRLNTELEEDIGEFITERVSKKRHRKLRKLRKELDSFIQEFKELQKENYAHTAPTT
jgi:uncharacterized coiled-coil protein SlyX